MQSPNRLPLVKQSLRLLVDKLRPDDRVAIAVYAGASGLALPSTPVSHKAEILEAIDRLEAGGSTNGAMGIQLAYDIAKANFITSGVNRVILATDGDFNVGTTSEGELTRLIEEKAKSGVFPERARLRHGQPPGLGTLPSCWPTRATATTPTSTRWPRRRRRSSSRPAARS